MCPKNDEELLRVLRPSASMIRAMMPPLLFALRRFRPCPRQRHRRAPLTADVAEVAMTTASHKKVDLVVERTIDDGAFYDDGGAN